MSAGYGTIMTRSYMQGFLDALRNLPKREPKKFIITVQGKKHEVTLEKKLWAQQHGEENLIFKDNEIVVRPTTKPKTRYTQLLKAERGYVFIHDDIHWPSGIAERGVTWQIESE